MGLLIQQKTRHSDTNMHGAWTIRTAIFQIILFRFFVSQNFVSFGNQDEFCRCLAVVLVFVRVVFQRQLSVDLAQICTCRHVLWSGVHPKWKLPGFRMGQIFLYPSCYRFYHMISILLLFEILIGISYFIYIYFYIVFCIYVC